jgi:hypothetical protein
MSIELIKAKQKELAKAKAAAENERQALKELTASAFASTGIPAMWEQIKDIQVADWRGNGSRDNDYTKNTVPLHQHLKKLTDTELSLRDWNDNVRVRWYAESTDKGAIWLRASDIGTGVMKPFSAEGLRDHFVEYMAKLLPPME